MSARRSIRGRVAALAAAVGAFSAFAVAPLVSAPPAQAEVVDDVIEEIFAPFLDASTSTVDWDALWAPAAWDAFLDPAHWDGVLADLGDLGTPAAADAFGDPAAWTGWFDQFVYAPLHAGVEAWINSSGPTPFLDGLNEFSVALGLGPMIADGADGTAQHLDGLAGGWLFGDGGDGFDSTGAGVAGGDGGAAGMFGTGGTGGDGGVGGDGAAGGEGGAGGWLLGVGGAGGDGGDGVTGGHGGDGGDGPGLFGIGGAGGDAGNGGVGGAPVGAHPLPALGGAGGNGGVLLGQHGAVGHFGTIIGSTDAPSTSDFGTAGGWITDSDGRVVILHGTNQVQAGKLPPYDPTADGFDDADAAFLAANGINSVRLGIQWAGVEPTPGVIDYDYLASIQQTVQMLSNHGIGTVLDMHQDLYSDALGHIPYEADGAPDWAVQTGGLDNPGFGFPLNYLLSPAQNHAWDAFWSNADAPDGVGLQNHYAGMWQAVADYFEDDPNIVGYEIMNEPWPGSTWLPTALGNPAFDHESLTPFYNQVVSAIRSVDSTTTVYFEPSVLFTDVPQPVDLGTVDDPNTVFAFHDYCITAALFGGNFGCSIYEGLIQDFAQDYANSHDIPAIITEWGNTNYGPTLDDTMNEANLKGFGWMYWEDTILIHDRAELPVGDNIDTGVQAALAEPYPQAISGIPNPWSYDDGVFSFSYSTAMADGAGSFGAGAQTTISVPAFSYPDGYQVSVTGGQVVSAANASLLVIAANAGASTVNVVVSPAA